MSIKMFKEKKVKFDDVINLLRDEEHKKLKVIFPFDGSLKGNSNEIITKILFINYRESTQIKNRDIGTLEKHISTILQKDDLDILYNGKLNERYFNIVESIAFGHGITGKSAKENNLTSFSSKFCGSHNQRAPFWDNLVNEFLQYLGYRHEYRNYRAYVNAFKRLQKEHDLMDFSLREIEEAMWQIAKHL